LERAGHVLAVTGCVTGLDVRGERVLERLEHAVDSAPDEGLVIDVVEVPALERTARLDQRPAGRGIEELASEVTRDLCVNGHGGGYHADQADDQPPAFHNPPKGARTEVIRARRSSGVYAPGMWCFVTIAT